MTYLPVNEVRKRSQLKSIAFRINADQSTLADICSKYDVTLASVCQLAWALVLRCLLGSNSICFSYVVSGRDASLPGIERAVGPFISTLVSRVEMGDVITVEALLQQAVSDYLRGLANQYADMNASTNERAWNGSARKWGNTILSFRRKLDASPPGSDLLVELNDVVNPTDVSSMATGCSSSN